MKSLSVRLASGIVWERPGRSAISHGMSAFASDPFLDATLYKRTTTAGLNQSTWCRPRANHLDIYRFRDQEWASSIIDPIMEFETPCHCHFEFG